MEFPAAKRSIIIGGARTSVSLEEPFWQRLKDIAVRRELPLSGLVHEIAQRRGTTNLSSAIRTFVLLDYEQQLDECRRQLERTAEDT